MSGNGVSAPAGCTPPPDAIGRLSSACNVKSWPTPDVSRTSTVLTAYPNQTGTAPTCCLCSGELASGASVGEPSTGVQSPHLEPEYPRTSRDAFVGLVHVKPTMSDD